MEKRQSPDLTQFQSEFLKNYPERYRIEIKPITKATNTLVDLGLQPEGFVEIQFSGSMQKPGQEPHYHSYVNLEQGILVLIRAYRNDDKKEQGGNPPHFSEVLFQQWVQISLFQKRADLAPLKQVYIYHIREQGLLDILFKCNIGEMEQRVYDPTTHVFQQISLSPFGKALTHLMKDHFQKLSIQSLKIQARKPGIAGLQPPYDAIFPLAE